MQTRVLLEHIKSECKYDTCPIMTVKKYIYIYIYTVGCCVRAEISGRKYSVAANQSINITVTMSYSQSKIHCHNKLFLYQQSVKHRHIYSLPAQDKPKEMLLYWLKVSLTFQSFFHTFVLLFTQLKCQQHH